MTPTTRRVSTRAPSVPPEPDAGSASGSGPDAANAGSRADARPAAGLEDVTAAVRVLARNSRDLVTDAGAVLEREMAMAIEMSERLRDETVSRQLLKQARSLRVQADLRDDAHRVVDLVADAIGVASVSVVRFAERMADEPRPRVASVGTSVEADSA